MTTRVLIVEEMIRRLQAGFPAVPVRRGAYGYGSSEDDIIHVFEDDENLSSDFSRPTLYQRILYLEVEAIFRVAQIVNGHYVIGNTRLEEIRASIDKEPSFKSSVDGCVLANHYFMDNVSIVFVSPRLVNVVTRWRFEYTSVRFG